MDFNFADLKKEAAATADDIYHQTGDAAKKVAANADDIFHQTGDAAKKVASDVKHDLLGSGGQQDDNAHTEHYFANEQKDFDFEHVDPQTFVQRMSAGAKEAQEQLDAKFAHGTNQVDDFLTNASKDLNSFGNQLQQDTRQGMASLTNDFMNAERSFFGGAGEPNSKQDLPPLPKPKTDAVPAVQPTVHHDDLMGGIGKGDGKFAPTAPPSKNYFEDNFHTTPMAKTTASNKDSDTDSPSVSYNPSPVKKNPVANALKDQDNEKFISSEDLLGDFKEERTATPDYHATSAHHSTTASTGGSKLAALIPTTDLDDDDFDDNFMHDTISSIPAATSNINTNASTAHSQSHDAWNSAPTVTVPLQPFGTVPPKHVETSVPTATAGAATATIATTPKPAAISEPVKQQPAPKAVPAKAPEIPTAAVKQAEPLPPVVKDTKPAAVAAKNDYTKGQQHPNIVSVEDMFFKYGLDAWFKPERLHPQVESLIYWRDVKKSGIVFGAGLILLLAISCFSVISVFAYFSLLLLAGTVAFRIYKSVMQAVQKTSDGHPFKEYLDIDLTLSQDKVQHIAGVTVNVVNGFIAELRRLFLVEDLVDSIKFGVILWVMTYIGAWFNGMTLVILAFVSLFTLPKVYENNKQSIDTYLDLVRSKFTEITEKIKVAIPIGNKKPIAAETDKDK